MKRFVVTAVIASFFGAGSALAADLPQPQPPQPYYAPPAPVPVYNWSGFYLGINGGYGFASGNRTATLSGNEFGLDDTVTGSGNLNGFLGGGQIGANWQWDALVLGVEADFQGTAQSKTENFGCGFGCVLTEDIKIPWFATARARAGIAFDRVLAYATGGAVWMHASDTLTASDGTATATLLDLSTTKIGWTAGAGVEVALAQNWTARVEYLFMDVNPSFTGDGTFRHRRWYNHRGWRHQRQRCPGRSQLQVHALERSVFSAD